MGQAQCMRKRFLQFSALNGYGFVRNSNSLPLATGIYVHEALAGVLRWAKMTQTLNQTIDVESAQFAATVRPLISKQIDAYKSLVTAKGFLNIEGAEEIKHIMEEQASLIEGLTWGWCRAMLPDLLANFTIVDVEEEELFPVGEDIVQMSRPDFILRRKVDGKLALADFKTSSYVNESYAAEYRNSIQMAVGTLGAEHRLKEPIEFYYIFVLVKGQRKNEYEQSTGDYSGPRRQNSPFCYGYCRPANPPLEPDENWQPKWKYLGADGKKHTLGRNYEKTPIWKGSFSYKPKDMTNAEFWARSIPMDVLEEHFVQIGPYERQDLLIPEYLKEMVHEERRYIQNLWKLFEFETETGSGWETLAYQDKLCELFPRSWNCYSFSSPCPYIPVCFKHPGWTDPLGTGKFVLRTPHHGPETEQALARGVEIPTGEEVEEDE
jgi:hypothetical protein